MCFVFCPFHPVPCTALFLYPARLPVTVSSRAGAGRSQTSTSPTTVASAPATLGTSGARSGSRRILTPSSVSPTYADLAGAPLRSCLRGAPESEWIGESCGNIVPVCMLIYGQCERGTCEYYGSQSARSCRL